MTLQELLRTVWFGRWLVAVSLVAAVVGATLYLSRQEEVYRSRATVQLVGSEVLDAAGVSLDSDPSVVPGTAVAEAVAEAVGDPVTVSEVTGALSATYTQDTTDRVAVSALNADPDRAVALADAAALAYVAEMQAQFDRGIAAMRSRLGVLGTSIEENRVAIDLQGGGTDDSTSTTDLLEAQYAASMEEYQGLLSQIAAAQVVASPASIRQAAGPAQLESVSPLVAYLVAGLGGTVIGVGLAIARRGLDTKVRTAAAARHSAGVPVLARLQASTPALRVYLASGDLPVAIRTATPFTQSVRELRTALQAAVEGTDGAVIVVTSAGVEVPRSFFAANLAASFALSGRSVIALSGDLRQPRLNAMLPAVPSDPEADKAGAGASTPDPSGIELRATSIPHLRVHPALLTELDPADYLASDDVRDLIDRLRASADVVIVDAPPILVAADAAILGGYADGVLLAATAGETQLTAVEEAAGRLLAANARLLGVVLDGADDRRRAAYATTYSYTGHAAEGKGHDSADRSSSDKKGDGSMALLGSG